MFHLVFLFGMLLGILYVWRYMIPDNPSGLRVLECAIVHGLLFSAPAWVPILFTTL